MYSLTSFCRAWRRWIRVAYASGSSSELLCWEPSGRRSYLRTQWYVWLVHRRCVSSASDERQRSRHCVPRCPTWSPGPPTATPPIHVQRTASASSSVVANISCSQTRSRRNRPPPLKNSLRPPKIRRELAKIAAGDNATVKNKSDTAKISLVIQFLQNMRPWTGALNPCRVIREYLPAFCEIILLKVYSSCQLHDWSWLCVVDNVRRCSCADASASCSERPQTEA